MSTVRFSVRVMSNLTINVTDATRVEPKLAVINGTIAAKFVSTNLAKNVIKRTVSIRLCLFIRSFIHSGNL